MPLSAARPASSSFIAAIRSCSSGGSAVCSRIGSMMFCATESDENSAPCWNSTPMSAAFSAGPSAPTGLPFSEHLAAVRPVQAGERLEQHRLAGSRTAGDAEDFAGRMSRSIRSCTCCLPKRLTMPRADRMGSACCRRRRVHSPSFSNRIENSASSTITRKIALHHRAGGLAADALRRAPHPQPVHAADDADEEREDRRLDQADEQIAAVDGVANPSTYCSGDTSSSDLRNQALRRAGP